MKALFKGIFWIFGFFILSAIAAALDGRLGLIISGLGVVAAIIFLARPRSFIVFERRWVSFLLLLVACLTSLASIGRIENQKTMQVIILRERDPFSYLKTIKGKVDDTLYMTELKALDPKGHAAEIEFREDERREKEKAVQLAKEAEIADILQKLNAKLTLLDEQALRQRLLNLAPERRDNTARLAKIDDELRAIVAAQEMERQRVAREIRARSNPEEFLELIEFNWHKGGFSTVMMADFKVRNRSPFDIKDIRFSCEHSGASGTKIDANSQVVFDLLKAGTTRTFRNINMGFVHTQAASSSCRITSAKSIGR